MPNNHFYRRERLRERIEESVVELLQLDDQRLPRERLLRWFLGVLRHLSRLYLAGVQTRLFLYRKGIFRHHALGCQVISIGNLTVGGTGKTPVVEVFARELHAQGRKVAILSRGYKKVEFHWWRRLLDKLLRRSRQRLPRIVSDGRELLLDSAMSGDEPYMLATRLPQVVVLVDKNRVKSGRYAISRFHCDTLVLDDGFQYMSLKHRQDIVLIDRLCPFANGHVLPRGLLREPIGNLRRANVIFLTKCDGGDTGDLQRRIRQLNEKAEIIECRHRARYLRDVYSESRFGLETLRGMRVAAVSGIAAPEGFEDDLLRHGATIVLRRRFADHHRYRQQEVLDLINQAGALTAEALITTEKDAVRFPKIDRRDIPVYFMRVEIELLSGTESFHDCIARICYKPTRNRT